MITELPIQGLPTGKRPPFVVVASDDTPDFLKKSADFVCDGVNDHVEIQEAINKVSCCGGTVILLAGYYNIAGDITIDFDNLSIIGFDQPTLNATADSTIKIGDPGNGVTVSNITIEGISMSKAHGTVNFALNVVGVDSGDVNSYIVLKDLNMSIDALNIRYVSDIQLIGNSMPPTNINYVDGAKIVGNWFSGVTMSSGSNSYDIRIINNYFWSPSGSNYLEMNNVDRLIISNNIFRNYKLGGLSDKGCVVSNNVFYNSYITASSSPKIVISSNKFYGDPNYYAVIETQQTDATIIGNVITDISTSVSYAIYNSSGRVSISGNTISGSPGNTAIYVTNRASISGNYIYNFTTGIDVEGVFSSIQGNVIDTCSGNGILVNGSYNTVVGNNITSCDTGINLGSYSSYNYVGKNIITNYSTAGINDSGSNNIIGVKDTTNNIDNYY